MSKIRILPEQLANQIAAGEVVERPASVVKELVENSLDAGADQIEIEIEGGGTRLIRIIDNGEGMDEDDVLLSLERHGTSKMSETNDLSSINTLGFRGEAIPSIASVSRMIITSRQQHSELGTTVVSHFGTIKKVHEAGAKVGTRIEISNLFGNTPARRKFLRTTRTELSHIDDTVKNYGLARPDVSFVLRIDGRETVRLDHGMNVKQRLAALLHYSGEFIPIESGAPGPENIRVSGLLVPPESSSPVAGRLRFFVNGRAIRDRMLAHGANEGLRSFLLKGRSPAGFLALELPTDTIDVNVHPAKHEVRFRDSRTIHQKVLETVRNGMIKQQQQIRQDIFSFRSQEHTPSKRFDTLEAVEFNPAQMIVEEKDDTRLTASDVHPDSNSGRLPEPRQLFQTRESAPFLQNSTGSEPVNSIAEQSGDDSVSVDNLIIIGSFQDLYIFCRNGDRLIVIDQHAAHERLLYEHLRNQHSSGKIASQALLFPVTVELSSFQSQLVEKNLENLVDIGFSVRDFGGNTWIIGAVPALAGAGNPQDLLFDVLEQFGSDKERTGGGKLDTILATMACKAAVKSGDRLTDPEIRALLERMVKADLFSHCPHGRPVVKTFRSADISRWFQRT